MSFAKLHGDILYSSIWAQPHPTRIVWITLLAMADRDGVVRASVTGLAHLARVTLDECREALACFLGPDPDSRDRTTGERIEEVPGGWLLLNHANYRDRQTHEQLLTAKRVAKHSAKRKHRALANADTPLANVSEHNLTPHNATSPSDAESDAEPEQKGRAVARPDGVSAEVWSDFGKLRRAKRAPLTPTAFRLLVSEAAKAGWALEKALQECVARGWTSFKAEWVKPGRFVGKHVESLEHPRNMPLGATSCGCEECVRFRLRRQQAGGA